MADGSLKVFRLTATELEVIAETQLPEKFSKVAFIDSATLLVSADKSLEYCGVADKQITVTSTI